MTDLISFHLGDSGILSGTKFKSIISLVLSLLYGPTLTSVHDNLKTHNLGEITTVVLEKLSLKDHIPLVIIFK